MEPKCQHTLRSQQVLCTAPCASFKSQVVWWPHNGTSTDHPSATSTCPVLSDFAFIAFRLNCLAQGWHFPDLNHLIRSEKENWRLQLWDVAKPHGGLKRGSWLLAGILFPICDSTEAVVRSTNWSWQTQGQATLLAGGPWDKKKIL